MMDEQNFTADQAVAVQRALRATLGLPDEVFPLAAFIGMISDEIEQLRAAGHPDQKVLETIHELTGHTVSETDLARFYAPAQARRD